MVTRRPPSESDDAPSNDALRDALAERDDLRLRLAELRAAGGEFLAAAAHAVRSPLTVTHSYLEMLVTDLSEGLTEEQRSFLGIAHDNAVKLRRLVDDLAELAALETGTARIDAAPTAAADVGSAVARELAPIAERKGLELILEIAADLPEVVVDRERLKDVLRRLLDNAVRLTPAGGTVGLRARSEEGRLVLEVYDSGAGIPEARVSEALRPFVQLHRSPGENREGYGLGLPLCRLTIEAFGGTLELSSAEGRGTTVVITLPAVNP